jgi:hypothetical protein
VAIFAQGFSLLSPAATRFAKNIPMVARVFDVKEVLKQIVIDME